MAQKFTVPVTIKNLSSAGSDGLTVFLDQESFARLKVEAGGRITWGDGAGAGDTNLYRDAASVLKTDDTFKAAGLFVSGTEIDTVGATTGDALIFNGTKFVSASVAGGGATLTVSDTAPEDPSLGDLWFNSTDLEIYVYYSSAWVQVTDSSSGVQELYELVDVLIDNPVSGETLVYNGTEWENGLVSAGVATSLETARIIQLSGDVSGSVLFDGSQDVNIATTVLGAGSVTLGTNTSGDYVESLVAGTGVTLTNNSGESATPTVAIGQDVGTSASVTFAKVSSDVTGDLTGNSDTATALETARTISLGGDLSGSVSFDGTSNVTITATVQPDSVALGTDTTGNYVNDVTAGTGVTVTHTPGEGSSPTVAIGQSVDTSASVTFANVSADLVGNVTGNLTGDVTGNADTATALETARIISLGGDISGSVSFNGTSDVTISAVIQPDSVALGTDTSGDYVSSLVAGTGVTLTNNSGETATPTIAIGQDVATSASVTFSHVSAPVTGNVIGDLTGNADTATALETARTIELSGDVSGSASFDGTSSINIFTTVNTSSVAIGELYGVNITDPLEFQTLEYNGTEWVNANAQSSVYVRNAEATTITTGTAVYLFGATGDHASVKRADNTSDTTSSKTVGLVANNILSSENGVVVTQGYVDGIDLSVGYTPGDVLWLGKNGEFTTAKPSAPDHLVFIGVVVRATNNGIVYVSTQNGYEIEELHNVKINGVTDGQFLRYNSASTVWVNDTINLGTDTSGDYVQSLTAGTGVTLSNNSGESATPTVAIGQDVATSASVTFARLIVQGDMEVQGTITRLNEANLDVDTAFIYLNANSASANPDMGIAFNYDDGTYRHAGLFRDSSDGIFKVFDGYEPEPVSPINTSDATYSDARFQAESLILTQVTGTAPMSVSSSTVVTNLNADKLDGQDGSYYAPIDSPTFTGTVSLPNDTVALGTQTTGNYVADVSGGTGVNVTHTPGEGTTPSIAIGQDVAVSASVSFAAVTAPLIGNVTGNADTATTLATSRTIELTGDVTGSVSFNGSANASITAAIAANSVALGTDTTGNYMSDVSAGTGISVTHTPSEGSTGTVAIDAGVVPQLGVANTFTTNQVISGATTSDLLRITQTGSGNALVVEDSSNPDSTPFVITSVGEVIHGHTAVESEWYMSSGNSHRFFIVDNDDAGTVGGNVWLERYNGAAGLSISRSNGTNIGDRGAIVSGDIIGGIAWSADDAVGGGHVRTAQIVVTAEGTIGTNIVPSRMTFSTGNTIGLDTERMRIDSVGAVGIGTAPTLGTTLHLGKNHTGATTTVGLDVRGAIQEDVTVVHLGIRSQPSVAASVAMPTIYLYSATGSTLGAGASLTTQGGFVVQSSMTQATSNYGFWGALASATGRYNLYMSGTAANYLAGRLGVGATLTSGAMAQVTNTTAADKAFVVKGAASQTGNLFEVQNSAATALVVVNSAGLFGVGWSGGTITTAFGSTNQKIQAIHAGVAGPQIIAGTYANNTFGPRFDFVKSRNATANAQTVVASNDSVMEIYASGSDGTGMIPAARIAAEVDGTPDTNDMPGRLMFSTTADGASSVTERMRIDSSGQVGIGGTPAAGRVLAVSKTLTGATTSTGISYFGTIQSDVTANAYLFYTVGATQATAFTLGSLNHFRADQGTFGAGSTVTNQFGFVAAGNLVGATNNFAFYGGIPAATGNWNIHMAGTAANYMAGRLGVGAALTSGAMAQVTNTTAADVALIVKGAAAQSGYLTEWQDSAGATVAWVSSTGASSFGNAADSDQSVLASSIFG